MARAQAKPSVDRPRASDASQGQASDVHVELGRRLRERRQELGLSLAELAARTQLTKGHLSRIEGGLASPSMASLLALCDELRVHIGALFDPPRSSLVRVSERVRIDYGGEGLEQYLLTPGRARLQVYHTTFEPGGTAGAEQYSVQAEEEFILVLSGAIVVELSSASHTLYRDDAFTFDPREKHTFRNPSPTKSTRVLFVVTPPL